MLFCFYHSLSVVILVPPPWFPRLLPCKSQARLSQSDPFSNRSHSCNNRRLSDSLPPLCSRAPPSPDVFCLVQVVAALQADDVGGGAVTDAVFVHLHIHSLFAHRVSRPRPPSLSPTRKGQVGASREHFISARPQPPNIYLGTIHKGRLQ